MRFFIFLTSPLEQFHDFPLFLAPFFVRVCRLSVTSGCIVVTLLFLLSVLFMCSLIKPNSFTYYIVPNSWQYAVEQFNLIIISLVYENVKHGKAQNFVPLLYTVFGLNFLFNFSAVAPYAFVFTSQLSVTFGLALILFTGLQIIGFINHGMHYFSILLPPGTQFHLALILVPIELVSFLSRPLSLAIRLFVNMMAGHTLLKVIAGFACSLMGAGGTLVVIHFFPVMLLIVLVPIEAGVALIQTFVFSILIALYLNSALNLH
jgi:ATP synthase subunit 6